MLGAGPCDPVATPEEGTQGSSISSLWRLRGQWRLGSHTGTGRVLRYQGPMAPVSSPLCLPSVLSLLSLKLVFFSLFPSLCPRPSSLHYLPAEGPSEVPGHSISVGINPGLLGLLGGTRIGGRGARLASGLFPPRSQGVTAQEPASCPHLCGQDGGVSWPRAKFIAFQLCLLNVQTSGGVKASAPPLLAGEDFDENPGA